MAHKKKGKKSAASSAANQGNGAAKQPGTQATGEPQSFKDAVLKDLHADAPGTSPAENGAASHDDTTPSASPRGGGGGHGPNPNGKPSSSEPPSPANVNGSDAAPPLQGKQKGGAGPGELAQRDAHKALEQTVELLKGDLRAEQGRLQQAETYLLIYKAATASLGLTTLGFAALALVALSRCRN